MNPSNKNSHNKHKPDHSISVKKVWYELEVPCLALPCLAFPSPSLPSLLFLKDFKNKLLTYLQNILNLQLKDVMTEFVGNLSLGKSRDRNSSKEIIGLLVKKVLKGSISSAVKFEGSTLGSAFSSNEFHCYMQKKNRCLDEALE